MRISIAFPSSVLEDCPDLKSKTIKIGQIARACAIFNIEMIYIIKMNKEKDLKLIKTILKYIECPQYLRKLLFPISNSLKYAGLLPPLATPHHQINDIMQKQPEGGIREGIVLKSNEKESIIEIGTDRPIKISIPNLKEKKRVTVEIIRDKNRLTGKIIEIKNIQGYRGYKIEVVTLKSLLEKSKNAIIIGTSRKGHSFKEERVSLERRLIHLNHGIIIFGSPKMGIQVMFKREKLIMEDKIDFLINAVENQGTRTIRTEEAIFIVLSLLNSCLNMKPSD